MSKGYKITVTGIKKKNGNNHWEKEGLTARVDTVTLTPVELDFWMLGTTGVSSVDKDKEPI